MVSPACCGMKHRLRRSFRFLSISFRLQNAFLDPATYYGIFNRICGRFDFLTPIGIQFFGLFLQCCMMICSTSQGSPSSFFSSLCHQQLASCKFRLLLRKTFCWEQYRFHCLPIHLCPWRVDSMKKHVACY